MEKMRRRQIPAFGEWNYYCDELPITQYFDSAMQSGLVRGQYYQEGGEVYVMASPSAHKPTKKVRRDGTLEKRHKGKHGRKQSGVTDAGVHTPRKAREVKAVDEDLYKIPPDLLCPKPRRKRLMRNLWMGCLGLNCIA